MPDLEKMNKENMIKYITNLEKTKENNKLKISELQSTITKLNKQLGEGTSPHPDTPSLPVIIFRFYQNMDLYPFCEKHGAMNRYEYNIWRCNECGIAVNMTDIERKREVLLENGTISVDDVYGVAVFKTNDEELDTLDIQIIELILSILYTFIDDTDIDEINISKKDDAPLTDGKNPELDKRWSDYRRKKYGY